MTLGGSTPCSHYGTKASSALELVCTRIVDPPTSMHQHVQTAVQSSEPSTEGLAELWSIPCPFRVQVVHRGDWS